MTVLKILVHCRSIFQSTSGLKPAVQFPASLLLLLLLPPMAARAQFDYTTNNDTITLTRYTGPGGDVTIPSAINGLPVRRIGDAAFSGCFTLTSVTIPESITSLGGWVFSRCTGLRNIVVPDSVTSVGNLAFNECTRLTNVVLSQSLTTVGDGAFLKCFSLPGIALPNSITNLGDSAFSVCFSLTNITLPNGIPKIGNDAFTSCFRLTSLRIPGTVTTIGDGAFSACTGLTSLALPDSLTNIGSFAFSGCTSLTTLTIPEKVTSIGEAAFSWWSNLTGMYFKGNAPVVGSIFEYTDRGTVYYLPGTTGWTPVLAGRPTVLWDPRIVTMGPSFGVQTNGFGFTITGATNLVLVIEACTNLATAAWVPLITNTLTTGSFYFSDPYWTNSSARLYRLTWP